MTVTQGVKGHCTSTGYSTTFVLVGGYYKAANHGNAQDSTRSELAKMARNGTTGASQQR